MNQTRLNDLIKASYASQKDATSFLEKKRPALKRDEELSTMESKVFYNEITNKPIILHRGSVRVNDFLNDDVKIGFGLGKTTSRYRDAVKTTKLVEQKYGKGAIAVGDSLGGWLAENSGARGKIVTLNKATGITDVFKKTGKKQTDYRVDGDAPSYLSKGQTGGKRITVQNKHPSSNFLMNTYNAHSRINLG